MSVSATSDRSSLGTEWGRGIEEHMLERSVPKSLSALLRLYDQYRKPVMADLELMEASGRWEPGRPDPTPYVPGDISALRWLYNVSSMLEIGELLQYAVDNYAQEKALLVARRIMSLVAAVYGAAPFFLPAELAVAVAESDTAPPELIEDIRLPFESVWILLGAGFDLPDGMTWPSDTLWQSPNIPMLLKGDAAWEATLASELLDRGGAIDGVVVFSGSDGVGLADEIVWTVAASPDPTLSPPHSTWIIHAVA